MPRIRLEGLVKRYGAVEVLHGINLDMAEHEFTVLVGPSGCGKSTTLRMIAGLEDVSEGEVWMGDRAISRLDPKDRDIAMVFQDYALYPHMNVAKNMSFSLRLQKRPTAEIDRKVRDVADMLGLSPFLNRKPVNCRADSARGSRWGAHCAAMPARFCSMNRCPIWMRNCAGRCARNWR